MQSLSETEWDVVISGTGLQQSLLALALSRSNKNVLHIDQNDYYGSAEAAFSLQEVEEWVAKVNAGNIPEPFFNAAILKSANENETAGEIGKLSFSRAYTLALSPQIIYSRSRLLSQLVSSKVYRQLDFNAVGNWWIYDLGSGTGTTELNAAGVLRRIPNGREDVFADNSLDVRAKRSLMKFLKFVVDHENQTTVWRSHADESLAGFLSTVFNLPPFLQVTITALTLSLKLPSQTTVRYSLPRIARHLMSMGVFGPGFAAVIPKWGGASEIAQVCCRAGAVGGGVYILGNAIKSETLSGHAMEITLTNSEVVQTKALVTPDHSDPKEIFEADHTLSKMIAIISSDIAPLFTTAVEGGPTGAVSVIAFPSLSIKLGGHLQPEPVYVMAHSSETGECPAGQCVLYATSLTTGNPKARLEAAIFTLINCISLQRSEEEGDPFKNPKPATILYSVYYEQRSGPYNNKREGAVLRLAQSFMDLAFDDRMLDNVEDAWKFVMGLNAGDQVSPDLFDMYMKFEDREHLAEAEEDYGGA